MTLSEMRRLLRERSIRLTRSLGQSFMHDANQVRRVVAAAAVCSGEHVLEIGPGLGPLTERLLFAGALVLAIEKDQRLCQILRERFQGVPSLTLVEGDALDYVRKTPTDWRAWQMVANLPYSIGSPLMVELARPGRGPRRMTVTVQLEVARRMLASPGTSEYGFLTVWLQTSYQPAGWFRIPASCFFPAPSVDSACVVLARRPDSLVPDAVAETFRQVVRIGFGQRRKMLLKLLRRHWPEQDLAGLWESLGLSATVRAEELSPPEFARLASALAGA